MASRVRALDWGATELGAIATWPASLATMVDVVLSSPWPTLLYWGERAIQIYNDAARRALLGDRHRHALGAPAAVTWDGAWSRIGAAVESVRAGHGATVIEHVVVDAGREWSLAFTPVPDGQGHVGGVLVSAHETTREVRTPAFAMERAARQAAERQCEYLRSIFMQAPAAVAILRGPQHVVELSNEPMARAWGRAPYQAVGRPVFEVIPDAREAFQERLDRAFHSGQPYLGNEVPYRTEISPAGSLAERYANILITPLREPVGEHEIDGVLVVGVDITDQVRAREELRRLRGEAETANRAKDEFLAMLGHELRNPLSPITTALQVMRLRGDAGRELDVFERQVRHLTRLVDDLLDVSRATRGKIELHRRDLELADIVTEALEIVSPLLEQRRHIVEVDVPRKGLGVSADPERMVQAVSNVLTNAAKYSDPGARITIRGRGTGDKVQLSVRDHGVGIAPELLDRVFDLFVQQGQTIERARGGLGLGLPIARSLVELHGGTISAASEGVGRGSEFTIELPALVRELAPAPGPSVPVSAGELPPAQRYRILVVDDNEDATAMLGDALAHLGYQVAVAHDGPSALRITESFSPDVALLDIGLPVMNGYELAERLRAEQAPGDRPHLVAVTGYGQEADRQRSARAGFERHLVKPVDLGMLSEVVAELVSPAPHGA